MAQIAWIEDDNKRIGSLVKLLENAGHEIKRYSSWEEVMAKISEVCACDAIILDIILPPIDDDPYWGLTILRQLRNDYQYNGPVVVCSRVTNAVVLKDVQELGTAEILRKPVRPSMLYSAVTKALGGD